MKTKITDIISKFLAGESSSVEDTILSNWLGESNENLQKFTEIERVWNSMDITSNRQQFNSDTAFNQFRSVTGEQAKKRRPIFLKNFILATARWAAIGLVLITLGSAATYIILNFSDDRKTFEVQAPPGSRSSVTLSDGTTVWLNAGSRLTYSRDFGVKERKVNLEGEGYFNVTDNKSSPFTVVTTQLEITALGTSFNVKSYPEEDIIQTTLVSGLLMVTRTMYKENEKGVILEPNQQITYYMDSEQMLLTHESDNSAETVQSDTVISSRAQKSALPKIILSRGVDPEIFTSWKDNRLIFDNEPFESIAVKLERRFGARIIIKDEEIKEKRFKGRFDEITIEQALSALSFASPFEFHIKNDTIFITNETP